MSRLGLVIACAGAAALLAACGKSETGKSQEAGQAASSAQPAAELDEHQKHEILEHLPAPYNTADLANGEAIFGLCKSCHTTVQGGPNMTGPNLYGIVGEKAGVQPADFKFSDGLKAANITWTPEALDKWVTDPKAMVPDTKMTFVGLKDPKARTDVIAYLMVETGYHPK